METRRCLLKTLLTFSFCHNWLKNKLYKVAECYRWLRASDCSVDQAELFSVYLSELNDPLVTLAMPHVYFCPLIKIHNRMYRIVSSPPSSVNCKVIRLVTGALEEEEKLSRIIY